MNGLKKLMALLLTVAVAAVFTGCTTFDNFKNAFFGDGQKEDVIIFGVLEPQSGSNAQFGKEEIEGIELAHEMYPEVLGKKIELVYEDTQSSIYVSEAAAEELLAYNPTVIFGCYGNASALAMADLLEKKKIPTVGISLTNTLLTENHKYYATMSFNDTVQGQSLAKYVNQSLNSKNVAIFRQEDDETTAEVANKFEKEVKDLGTKIATKQYFKLEETDFMPYLQQIRKSIADTVFCPVGVEVADQLFTQAENCMMTNLNFVGTTQWNNEDFLKMMKKHPKIKAIVASDFAPEQLDTSISEQFLYAYKDKYGEEKEPSERAALAFDGYIMALKAIERAGKLDSELIMKEILATTAFEGVTGEISFDEYGMAHKPITINTVKNGSFQAVDIVKAKAAIKKDKDKEKSKKDTKKKTKKNTKNKSKKNN